jgi:hypothetical protein
MAGWIKLHRSILDKGWIKKPEYVQLWVVLLLMASHDNREYFWNGKTVKLKSGQLITGRKSLSEKTGISQTTIERILKCFESEHQIGQQKTSTSRLISILNWSKHQQVGQQSGQQTDNGRTTDGQPMDTNKELYNYYKDKNETNSVWFDLMDEWINYRKVIKEPLKPISLPKALKKLQKMSGDKIELATEIVDNSIANGYQGLFAPKTTSQNGKPKPSRQSATIQDFKTKYAGQSWIKDEPNN